MRIIAAAFIARCLLFSKQSLLPSAFLSEFLDRYVRPPLRVGVAPCT